MYISLGKLSGNDSYLITDRWYSTAYTNALGIHPMALGAVFGTAQEADDFWLEYSGTREVI